MSAAIRILHDPPKEEVQKHLDRISHTADVPLLVAARLANVDFLATLNSRHFLDNPEVSRLSGLRMGTPEDVLSWVREHLNRDVV